MLRQMCRLYTTGSRLTARSLCSYTHPLPIDIKEAWTVLSKPSGHKPSKDKSPAPIQLGITTSKIAGPSLCMNVWRLGSCHFRSSCKCLWLLIGTNHEVFKQCKRPATHITSTFIILTQLRRRAFYCTYIGNGRYISRCGYQWHQYEMHSALLLSSILPKGSYGGRLSPTRF